MDFLSASDWQAITLTVRLAGCTMLLLLLLATPLAWWLASSSRWPGVQAAIQALVALPLVLPPTVLGFYLLLWLGPHHGLGALLEQLGVGHLAFSFSGILLASVVYSLPFAVHPLYQAFSQLDRRQLEVAASLGAGRWDRCCSIILPQCKAGFAVAATLSFAHTLGEFGIILMLGGSIAGETKVLSIVIYDYAEAMDYSAAARLSGLLLVSSWLVLLLLHLLRAKTTHKNSAGLLWP